jgi:hypothetical protein
VVLVLAMRMAVHENEHGKIKTKPVEETIIGSEDMIKKMARVGVLVRLLSLYDFNRMAM